MRMTKNLLGAEEVYVGLTKASMYDFYVSSPLSGTFIEVVVMKQVLEALLDVSRYIVKVR